MNGSDDHDDSGESKKDAAEAEENKEDDVTVTGNNDNDTVSTLYSGSLELSANVNGQKQQFCLWWYFP